MMTSTELRALAEEAVVYAWPLYEMSRMRVATSPRRTEAGDEALPSRRWCNLFTHSRQLLRAGASRVVTPNNDTLYTNAWLDLGAGPLVIDVPDTAGRYYVLGLLDFYTNPFAHIGQRLTGTTAGSFVIVPPGWQGELPAAFNAPGARIEAPTRWVWIIGRILVDGPTDVAAVNLLQDGFVLRSLADWVAGRDCTPQAFDPACDPKAPLTPEHFTGQVNAAMRDNPPPANEAALLARLASVGVGPAIDKLTEAQRAALAVALSEVLPRLRTTQFGHSAASGWIYQPVVEGGFSDDYLARAQIALKYIGMLETREATYPMAWSDARGQRLNGAHRYQLRFAPGALPPVEAFWSLTMYDTRDYMLVDNPIDRYAIGDRTSGLHRDTDGGLTIHIQHDPPKGEASQANWLPAPTGDFYLCLRAYLPLPALLDGRYALPPVIRLEDNKEPL